MFFAQDFSDATTVSAAGIQSTAWASACDANRLDTEMTVYLSAHVLPEFDAAKTWDELTERLKAKGFALKGRNGRVVLKDRLADRDICHIRDLGVTTRELELRFA